MKTNYLNLTSHKNIMGFEHITSTEDLNRVISAENTLVLIDFYADWCGPCRRLVPTLEALSEQYSNFVVYKVNVDDNAASELVSAFGIRGIPRVVCYFNGQIVKDFTGADSAGITQLANEYLG